jgi:hypothetical protein
VLGLVNEVVHTVVPIHSKWDFSTTWERAAVALKKVRGKNINGAVDGEDSRRCDLNVLTELDLYGSD